MDWQVTILTLGASLITGLISVVGNVIVTNVNLKKSLLESREETKKEYIRNKIDCYNQILQNIFFIEKNINDDDVLEKSKLEYVWLKYYPYFSKELSSQIYHFIKYFGKGDVDNDIMRLRDQIKLETDECYGIKNKK